MRAVAGLLLALVSLAATGCPEDGPDPPPGEDAGAPEIQIATGFVDPDTLEGWIDLVDGLDVDLVRGPQGGQHVWTNIRQRGMLPQRMTIHMRLYVLDDAMGVDLPEPLDGGRADLRLSFQPRDDDSGFFEVANLTLFVPEPDDVVGHRCRIEVQLVDSAGLTGTETVEVNVDWGEGQIVPGRDGGGGDGGVADAGELDADAPDAG